MLLPLLRLRLLLCGLLSPAILGLVPWWALLFSVLASGSLGRLSGSLTNPALLGHGVSSLMLQKHLKGCRYARNIIAVYQYIYGYVGQQSVSALDIGSLVHSGVGGASDGGSGFEVISVLSSICL